jgi:hypothetical protein
MLLVSDIHCIGRTEPVLLCQLHGIVYVLAYQPDDFTWEVEQVERSLGHGRVVPAGDLLLYGRHFGRRIRGVLCVG